MRVREARLGRRWSMALVGVGAALLFLLAPFGTVPLANRGVVFAYSGMDGGGGGGTDPCAGFQNCTCVNNVCKGSNNPPPTNPPTTHAPTPPPTSPPTDFTPSLPPSGGGRTPTTQRHSSTPKVTQPASDFQPAESHDPAGQSTGSSTPATQLSHPLDNPDLVAASSPDDDDGWAVGAGVALGAVGLIGAIGAVAKKPDPAPAPAPPINANCSIAAYYYRQFLLIEAHHVDTSNALAHRVANFDYAKEPYYSINPTWGLGLVDKQLVPATWGKNPDGSPKTTFDHLAEAVKDAQARRQAYENDFMRSGCGTTDIFHYGIEYDTRWKPANTPSGYEPARGTHWVGDHWEDWSTPGVRDSQHGNTESSNW